jgi:cysteinyl-tRNA synthetase
MKKTTLLKILDKAQLSEKLKLLELGIYCCGPTIYKELHKGNYRPLFLLDYLYKTRKELGLETKVIVNITDIDDKIFDQVSKDRPIEYIDKLPSYIALCQRVLKDFYNKLEKLGLSYKEWTFIRVSENIKEMMNNCLHIPNKKVDDGLIFGEGQAEFYLWKEGHLTGTIDGHPSWHLECASIIAKELVNYSEILHLGGIDLKEIHHTNEIRLLEYLLPNTPISFYYSGLYYINNNKMSKSLNNEEPLSDNYLYERINYLLSDFNRPLYDNLARKEEILKFIISINKIKDSDKILDSIVLSPASLYRKDKSLFLKLLKKYNYL